MHRNDRRRLLRRKRLCRPPHRAPRQRSSGRRPKRGAEDEAHRSSAASTHSDWLLSPARVLADGSQPSRGLGPHDAFSAKPLLQFLAGGFAGPLPLPRSSKSSFDFALVLVFAGQDTSQSNRHSADRQRSMAPATWRTSATHCIPTMHGANTPAPLRPVCHRNCRFRGRPRPSADAALLSLGLAR